MENTEINRTMFFAQYLFQPILMAKISDLPLLLNTTTLNDYHDGDCLQLKPLSSITDDDAIYIARLAHQNVNKHYEVERQSDIIYVKTPFDKVGIQHFISIRPNLGTVCATINFSKTDTEEFKCYTVNIGQISISSERPIPYISIIDYLRSKGYAMPYFDLSVKKLIEYGWVKL